MPRSSTLVLLVRHGLTPTTGKLLPGRAPGLHLADEGRRQAEAVAARIGKLKKVTAIYCSPLERARETAAPIARVRDLALRIDRGLMEADTGEWTGKSLARLRWRPEWRTVQYHPSGFRFPGGDSFAELQARVVTTVGRLAEAHRGGTIVAVSHADPIKLAVTHAMGTHLDLFQRVMIGLYSVSAIVYRPEGPLVLTVNSMDGDLAALGQ